MGGDLAPSWGDVKNIGRPNFRMTFFSEKNSISTPKISDDFYLFIYRILSAFFDLLSLLSNPFLDEKPLFQNKKFHRNTILVSSYFAAHPITLLTLLLEILGGRMHGPSLPQILFWGTVPQFP